MSSKNPNNNAAKGEGATYTEMTARAGAPNFRGVYVQQTPSGQPATYVDMTAGAGAPNRPPARPPKSPKGSPKPAIPRKGVPGTGAKKKKTSPPPLPPKKKKASPPPLPPKGIRGGKKN